MLAGLRSDSRAVVAGDVFFALPGLQADGMGYAVHAQSQGAIAVVGQAQAPQGLQVPYLQVPDAALALAKAAAVFNGEPSRHMKVVGITGTNGKTTSAFLTRHILQSHGYKVGLIGTVEYAIGDEIIPAPYTTPEATEFQGLLSRMLKAGCTHVLSEVSSHALRQRRAHATDFCAAAFTNLTPEHLDYHADMEDYFSAKAVLFNDLLSGKAVVNADDSYGQRLLAALPVDKCISFAIEREADVRAVNITHLPQGLSFDVLYEGKRYNVKLKLVGLPNVYNALTALSLCCALGVSIESSLAALSSAEPVRGRFERVDEGQSYLCLVDYAHTEDALQRLIEAARQMTNGRVITVFGCGGDRDRTKRPAMGRVATALSDSVVITSDNPRSEQPLAIIAQIKAGAARDNYIVEPDRARAISLGVSLANAGDIVLIAGKGHEEYQLAGGVKLPFSDRHEAACAIRARMAGKGAA